jgi:hypothetical protein
MKKLILAAAVLVLGGTLAASKQDDQRRRGIFWPLKVGQSVTLRDKGGSFLIATMDEEGPMSHKIAELGDDYIVLHDAADVTEIRIPIHAIKAVGLRTKPK